jgi:hypothetical protein
VRLHCFTVGNPLEDSEYIPEIEDSPEVLERKVDKLVGWIKAANHFVAFTGAGISTSAGISDFRGPQVSSSSSRF